MPIIFFPIVLPQTGEQYNTRKEFFSIYCKKNKINFDNSSNFLKIIIFLFKEYITSRWFTVYPMKKMFFLSIEYRKRCRGRTLHPGVTVPSKNYVC